MPHKHKKLSKQRAITHGFFGRQGGVSEGLYASLNCGPGSNDDVKAVRENRRRVMEELGAYEATLCTLSQVHSNKVMSVRSAWHDDARPDADAMVTKQPNLALGILTADCGPVLFADAEAKVIGAAHAGWKGAFGGVLENTVDAMESLGAVRDRIIAVIGPTISQASYEVSKAFQDNFHQQDAGNDAFFTDNHHFNLPAYIRHRLTQCGVTMVEDVAIDTYSNEDDYFSYRRSTHKSEPDYGRQISVIMVKE